MLLTRNPCPLSGDEESSGLSRLRPAASSSQASSQRARVVPGRTDTGPHTCTPNLLGESQAPAPCSRSSDQGVDRRGQSPVGRPRACRLPARYLAGRGSQRTVPVHVVQCLHWWDGRSKGRLGDVVVQPTRSALCHSLAGHPRRLSLRLGLGAARRLCCWCAPLSGSLLSFSGASILWCLFLVCFARHIVVSLCTIGPSLLLPPGSAQCCSAAALCDAPPSRPSSPSDHPPASVPGPRVQFPNVIPDDDRRRRRRVLCPSPTHLPTSP